MASDVAAISRYVQSAGIRAPASYARATCAACGRGQARGDCTTLADDVVVCGDPPSIDSHRWRARGTGAHCRPRPVQKMAARGSKKILQRGHAGDSAGRGTTGVCGMRKHCQYCGESYGRSLHLHTKGEKAGKWRRETPSQFKKRKYCCHWCSAQKKPYSPPVERGKTMALLKYAAAQLAPVWRRYNRRVARADTAPRWRCG